MRPEAYCKCSNSYLLKRNEKPNHIWKLVTLRLVSLNIIVIHSKHYTQINAIHTYCTGLFSTLDSTFYAKAKVTQKCCLISLCRYCIILWGKHVEIACFLWVPCTENSKHCIQANAVNTSCNGLFYPQLKALHFIPKEKSSKTVLLNPSVYILHYFVGKTCRNCLPVTQYLLYNQYNQYINNNYFNYFMGWLRLV